VASPSVAKATDLLLASYRRAYVDLLRKTASYRAKGRSTAYNEAMLADIAKILRTLDEDAQRWARRNIPKLYVEGIEEALQVLKNAGKELKMDQPSFKTSTSMARVHQHAVKALVDATVDDLTTAHKTIGRTINDHWRRIQLEVVTDKTLTGSTMREARKNLVERLTAEGLTAFKDSAGRSWNLDRYASMVVRSVTAEAQNKGLLNQLDEMDHDLVRMSDHRAGCPLCAPYEGRVYSRTGQTAGYPVLTDVPGFSQGYQSMHPNCRHRITPYVPEADPDAEKTKELSNRPFQDKRRPEDKEAYDRQQKMTRLRRERQKLEEQLTLMPKGPERDAVRERLRQVRGQQQALGKEEKQWRLKAAAENKEYYRQRDAKPIPVQPRPRPTPPSPPPGPSGATSGTKQRRRTQDQAKKPKDVATNPFREKSYTGRDPDSVFKPEKIKELHAEFDVIDQDNTLSPREKWRKKEQELQRWMELQLSPVRDMSPAEENYYRCLLRGSSSLGEEAQGVKSKQVRVGTLANKANIPPEALKGTLFEGRPEVVRGMIQEAEEWFKENCHPAMFESYSLDLAELNVFQGRSYARLGKSSVFWNPSRGVPVLVHELAHHVHWESESTRGIADAFWRRRTEGEQLITLYDGTAEKGYRDRFITPYIGKQYGASQEGLEVLSMGFEYMNRAPVQLRAMDPEHFNLVLAVMAGII